jgi:basic membrane protein A
MRKWLPVVLIAIMVVVPVLAGCSSGTAKCDFRIGLVTDVGQVDDKGFNQAAWEGVKQAAKDLKIADSCIGYIETKDAKDYINNMASFVDEGAKVVVTSGFAAADATAAAAKKYPNVIFIGTDQWYTDPPKNLAGLVFNEDESGFLAGALAALMSKSGTIGGVYGTDVVPPVVYFRQGYENGAKYAKPTIKVLGAYHPGGLATGFTDPQWGHETAATMISQGADVIFGAGGKTGNGGVEEAAKRKAWAIGVDVDQYGTLPAEVKPYLLSSAMKMITPGVVDLIKKAKDGKFTSGQVFGSASLAPYHDTDSKIPKEVKDKITEITKGIQGGTIKTGVKK